MATRTPRPLSRYRVVSLAKYGRGDLLDPPAPGPETAIDDPARDDARNLASDLRLKVEIIDRGSIIDGFQKVANRIALGLVLAALIVGAAMLMRVPTSFTILGYPGFAILLFILAAGGGFWMAWTILAGDVRTRQH